MDVDCSVWGSSVNHLIVNLVLLFFLFVYTPLLKSVLQVGTAVNSL